MNCKYCQKQMTGEYSILFCDRSCSAKFHNSKRKKVRFCKTCSKPIEYHESQTRKAYGKRIVCDKCHESKIYIKMNKRRVMNEKLTVAQLKKRKRDNARPWTDAVRSMARSWFPAKNQSCKCGYNKHVEVCHKRPITDFPNSATMAEINSPKNILYLCPNCHWEYDNL